MDSQNSPTPSPREKKNKKKRPSPRRDGREAALQFLYGRDLQSEQETEEETDFSLSEEKEQFWTLRCSTKEAARKFAETLIDGTLTHIEAIDQAITDRLANFSFARLTLVDRNILRIAVYEILYSSEVPSAVALNEAIEIAKRFGTDDSPAFVNGILDGVLKDQPNE